MLHESRESTHFLKSMLPPVGPSKTRNTFGRTTRCKRDAQRQGDQKAQGAGRKHQRQHKATRPNQGNSATRKGHQAAPMTAKGRTPPTTARKPKPRAEQEGANQPQPTKQAKRGEAHQGQTTSSFKIASGRQQRHISTLQGGRHRLVGCVNHAGPPERVGMLVN